MIMFTYQGFNSRWKLKNEEREKEQEKQIVVGGMEETETERNSSNGYLGYLQVMAHESRPSRCIKASDIAQNVKELGLETHIFLSIIYFSAAFNRVKL